MTATNHEKTSTVGKYLVSPLTRLADAGTRAAAVSIRSGKGQSTHDRVLRFDARFPSREDARRHAALQGLHGLCGLRDIPHSEPKDH